MNPVKAILAMMVLFLALSPPGLSQEKRVTPRQRTTETQPARKVRASQEGKRDDTRQKKTGQATRKQRVRTEDAPGLQPKPGVERERSTDPVEIGNGPAREVPAEGQISPQQIRSAASADHQKVFETVRKGLSSGQIGSFSDLLGPQVHVTLKGGESGYYSPGQAYYVLEKYLHSHRLSELEFNNMGETGETPFAAGKGALSNKGGQEGAQVYVSLSQVGERWVISQIKIY
jgi:hypothetical protein